jgi:exopolysaccharide production protein ExoQ
MVIDRLWFTDPSRNGPFAVPAIALSVWAFAYAGIFGPVLVLMLYALWFPLLLSPDRRLWGRPLVPLLILALPALALASVLWSDRPAITARAGVQYGTTVLLGLIAARATSIRSLAQGLAAGGTAVLAYSHLVGNYAYDVVDGTYAFAGAFQSKNQLGLFASLTLLGAMGALLVADRPLRPALLTVPAGVFAALTLVMTESATALITATLAVAVFCAAVQLKRLRPLPRLIVLCVLAALLAGGLVAAMQGGLFDSVLGIFGKDTTLTGRTYLWSRGIEYGDRVAPLGLGYQAFWVPGRAEAEELWTEFHIAGFSGFHFHNTPIEGYVALGPAGLVLLGGWILALPLLSLRTVMGAGQGGAAGLLAALALLFTIRAFVEIDVFHPYAAGSFLVPFLLLAMAEGAPARDAAARRQRTAEPRRRREPAGRLAAFSAGAK